MTKFCFKFTLLLLLLIVPLSLFGADGKIIGKISDATTGKALVGANVIIVDTYLGGATNARGHYIVLNVPPGTYDLKVSYMGHKSQTQSVTVYSGRQSVLDFYLEPTILIGEGLLVSANRAVERETPIAFTELSGEEMANNYTTGDLPDLIKYVPGVFTTTAGLGESEMYIRGFEADKVQIMINGIPVNDPESQHVYWSNWTGLSSNVRSVQVQRGSGSSLYGSGVFGGSVNIETMGLSPNSGWTFRSSVGYFQTQGVETGARAGRVADGEGGFRQYGPMNYNASLRYNSGLLYDGKLNFSFMVERKAGESYINGTTYDGYSVGLEMQTILNNHTFLLSFIGAPQKHNQARVSQDLDLIPTLGREYNRNNHPYQENYYFKPQASLRHEWLISDKQVLLTNLFITIGRGGGKYLRNDHFDTETGLVGFKGVNDYTDNKYFGRHARLIYENTGIVLTGYDQTAKTFEGTPVSYGSNIITSSFNHSWHNDSRNDHKQLGFNTYYQHQLGKAVQLFLGGEVRRWVADHYAYSYNFRSHDTETGLAQVFHQVQNRYDYVTTVTNMSGFGRILIKPVTNLTLMLDGQYARYKSVVMENLVEIFDFGAGTWTGKSYLTTMDLKNSDGSKVFAADDYQRTYTFFSPKFGANYNISDNLNVLANYAITHKEPKSYQWYNRDAGPGTAQPAGTTLDPEKSVNMEFGLGYQSAGLGATVNYYRTNYQDKIESILDMQGTWSTINAGEALHWGIEVGMRGQSGNFDIAGSFTFAKNRWQKMNVQEIFGADAADVEGKVVPFSPERMSNFTIGYRFGSIRVGVGFDWWDDYFATYTNKYTTTAGKTEEAKLPSFASLNANISVPLEIGGTKIKVRLDLNNILNRSDNYFKATYSKDYNRNDALSGKYHWYVLQAPLFNTFLTTEISL